MSLACNIQPLLFCHLWFCFHRTNFCTLYVLREVYGIGFLSFYRMYVAKGTSIRVQVHYTQLPVELIFVKMDISDLSYLKHLLILHYYVHFKAMILLKQLLSLSILYLVPSYHYKFVSQKSCNNNPYI